MQTECLATGSSSAELNVKVRFLQAVARTIGELKTPLDEWPVSTESGQEPDFRLLKRFRWEIRSFKRGRKRSSARSLSLHSV